MSQAAGTILPFLERQLSRAQNSTPCCATSRNGCLLEAGDGWVRQGDAQTEKTLHIDHLSTGGPDQDLKRQALKISSTIPTCYSSWDCYSMSTFPFQYIPELQILTHQSQYGQLCMFVAYDRLVSQSLSGLLPSLRAYHQLQMS